MAQTLALYDHHTWWTVRATFRKISERLSTDLAIRTKFGGRLIPRQKITKIDENFNESPTE